MIKKCKKCGLQKEHHAKGLCYACYRGLAWEPPKGICKRCERYKKIHAKGLCPGCYNFVFHSDRIKAFNNKKYHNIDPELYKKVTKECVVCGFGKIVDLHHLDENKANNSEQNLVGLCPNHHKMFHDSRYRKEVTEALRNKGFNVPLNKKWDFSVEN